VTAFRDRLDIDRVILKDGAFGTELLARGIGPAEDLFSARSVIGHPELVRAIHSDYIAAGAEIITANTFCTAPAALDASGLSEFRNKLTGMSIALAREAVRANTAVGEIIITASLSPLSNYMPASYPSEEQLLRAQNNHAHLIALEGIDTVFCETMTSSKEARAASIAARDNGMEFIVSFVPRDSRHLVSGETLDTALRNIEPLEPLAVCLNCCEVEIMDQAVSTLMSQTGLPVGVYASMRPEKYGNIPAESTEYSATKYQRFAERWLERGVKILGGCCGTGPEHIRIVKKLIELRA
jgi:S-methylmethionine-dependent homocysteine/selenocysteine methylase